MKLILQTVLVLITFSSFAQSTLDSLGLEVPKSFIEAKKGETVQFQLLKTGEDTQVVMRNAPKGAKLDELLNFEWKISPNYFKANAAVNFYLYRGDELIDLETVFIRVISKQSPPTFEVSCNLKKSDGVYLITPGTELSLKVSAYSHINQDSSLVSVSHYINDQPNIVKIKNGNIDISKNIFRLNWIPSERQLEHKYHRLTIEAIDEQGQRSKKVFILVLYQNNTPPYFKYPVLDEYYISENEVLSIDMIATDREKDSLVYKLNIPSKIGNPKLSQNGLFTWKLNQDQIKRLRSYFPMEVSIEVSEKGPEKPHTVTKTFIIRKSLRNEPPKILNLQNERVFEGLTLDRSVFIQDGNDKFSELDVSIIGAPKGMTWNFDKNLLTINWTPDYDIVGIDKQPKKFDMLLVVRDPHGFVDQKAFTVTVEHRENIAITYRSYMDYRSDAIFMVETLSQMHAELEKRESLVTQWKKGLSLTTMLFAVYTAAGNVFDDHSLGKEMVPYVGIAAAIAGGINAFGFSDLPTFGTIREQSFILQQKLMYILATLNEYKIDSENSPNLENVEFRERLASYEQWMVQDKLNFKSYYSKYRNLNFNQRIIDKERKTAFRHDKEPEGLLFMDISKL
ncbi:MAG: hypothetical protein OCD76_21650 [Reichenbachiella sp.]